MKRIISFVAAVMIAASAIAQDAVLSASNYRALSYDPATELWDVVDTYNESIMLKISERLSTVLIGDEAYVYENQPMPQNNDVENSHQYMMVNGMSMYIVGMKINEDHVLVRIMWIDPETDNLKAFEFKDYK